ncbi:polyamine-transporting ATPase [Aliidongia dinghuensis]|uniref:Spermidine/putrescine import ATP-binding protein PotA n=1 Tax=Aliidongia dinghuensis TaxID=1867774 RepID=A0A8J2YU12_9PROT|nr:ABC transporter ATP-binding protein [Aliidongia dinghuensis]GGF20978.1 polyamine-transporting ATPase [Aliidongia dinghuensis]
MSYLRLIDVQKSYGSGAIGVRQVSLDIAAGEFVTFLGPSGSGKTTTLSMVAGFVEPTEGRIEVAGRDITHVAPEKRNIGMVFQDYSLFPHLTVEENIAFPLEMRGVPRAEITRQVGEALEMVGLAKFARRFPAQMSGGQQQRVSIARAVVYRPSILLMDEPLGALDRMLRDRMQIEIKHIQKELGITTLYVTHDQGEALTMSDRICVFNEGEIVQVGTPTEIYERPASAFVAGFVGESNFLPARVLARRNGGGGYLYDVALLEQAQIEVPSERELPASAGITAVVRPEHIRILPDHGAGTDGVALPGTIRETIYRGEICSVRVELAGGGQSVILRSPGKSPPGRDGEPVMLGWAAEDMVLLAS